MKKNFTRLFRAQRAWLRAFSPILIGVTLIFFYLWLLSPSRFAQADLGTDLILVAQDTKETQSIAWGDMDGDGDLDLAIGNDGDLNQLYRNEGDGSFLLAWQSPLTQTTTSIAWGDMDGDGDLDLAVGNHADLNELYRNEGNGEFALAWHSANALNTQSVAWGDMDGDGDLDLAVGNSNQQANQLYRNQGGGSFTVEPLGALDALDTQSVAWGDWDEDGDLDLAIGNKDQVNQVFENDGTTLHFDPDNGLGWQSDDTKETQSVAWADFDGDGDFDLAVGNSNQQVNQLYRNEGDGSFSVEPLGALDGLDTESVAWGDWDADGDLDLAIGNKDQVNQVFENDGATLHFDLDNGLGWESDDTKDTSSVAWADMDGDGDLELAAGNHADVNQVYPNESEILKLDLENNLGWESISDTRRTTGVAWGDIDGDGQLDLAVSNRNDNVSQQVYRNEGESDFSLAWNTSYRANTSSVAWGDYDGDGDLDLAFGEAGWPNQVRENDNGVLKLDTENGFGWQSNDTTKNTQSVAWGDWDGDGDLDLAVGNYNQVNQVFENDGETLQLDPANGLGWESTDDSKNTLSVAWGDMDGDGDLDLAVANQYQVNQIYRNEGRRDLSLFWESTGDEKLTRSVAWGDMDGDGDLDLAVGNDGINQIYENDDGTFKLDLPNGFGWQSTGDRGYTLSLAWGDMDGDGDLDLAVGNYGSNKVYRNQGAGTFTLQSIDNSKRSGSVAWGDMDRDGDLDLAIGNGLGSEAHTNIILENTQSSGTGLPNNAPFLAVTRPGSSANANFYASAEIFTRSTIPITYTLFDAEADPLGMLDVFYSPDGGGRWYPAMPTTDTMTTNLTTAPYPTATITNSHVFTWDLIASGFLGQSDNVVLRFVAHSQAHTGISDTYQYPHHSAGPYLWPSAAATTFPFRVRGTQVRVYSDTIAEDKGIANAIIYHLPAGQTLGAEPFAEPSGEFLETDSQGYLEGRVPVEIGDRLIALLPITVTDNYTVYHTSATATITGLDAFTVTAPGVQELVVSADNPLILFDMDVSLEWDARHDETYLGQLENDLARTSQILYDLTNGQVALGRVRVAQAMQNWMEADIVVKANNSQHPNAILGGIVSVATDDIGPNGVISDAYIPGQVRIGATWNRFGEPDGTLGEDWPRALAHELGHYLLFMPDNYLGLTDEGFLRLLNCPGSAMTDPYLESYSEFLTAAEWNDADHTLCRNTLAEHFWQRSDWQTITSFYPSLNGMITNTGPSNLPLGVTQIEFIEPATPTTTLDAPFFHLIDRHGAPAPVPQGGAQGYLFKTHDPDEATDDYVTALGSPVGDLIEARGAEPGDRLCVFKYNHDNNKPPSLGCEAIGSTVMPLTLHEIADWAPQITVHPITSRTFGITVTNVSESALHVQLLPSEHEASETLPMTPSGADFVQAITLTHAAYAGFVRVWVPGSTPYKEMITKFTVSDPDAWQGGGDSYAWNALALSSDGQVTILDLDHFSRGRYTLQALPLPPALPTWLTPVGDVYRLSSQFQGNSAILFRYLGREVPAGQENGLRIYYSPDNGQTWQRLPTELGTYRNAASASIQGEGIYALMATVEMPPFEPGWNNFGYPVAETRPIATALASIDGYYNAVMNYDPSKPNPWSFYFPTVGPELAPFINDLTHLEFGRGYWLHATQAITLYLGVPDGNQRLIESGEEQPPAVFYGWITPSRSFAPTVGMTVTARIDGKVCGETTIREWNGKSAYKLQVADPSDCGVDGNQIVFEVGDSVMAHDQAWDNSQAVFHPLTTLAQPTEPTRIYLPLILAK